MALTTPVRDKEHLKRLAEYFLSRGQHRNYVLLVVCSHTALRISDVLRLTWADVYDFGCGRFRDHITLAEKKTGKNTDVALHPKVIEAMRLYFPRRRGKYIFASVRKSMAAISRIQAWRVLHDAAAATGLVMRVSAHALRKTFGYWAWKSGASPAVLTDIFNHSSYEITRRYLGITQDDRNKVYLGLSLF